MKDTPGTTRKLIGYARVSTRGQETDRQETDLLGAGIRKDDMYVDHGVSGARDKRPALDACLASLQEGDTLVITTLDRLGRSTEHMLSLSRELDGRGVNLRVLNLGGAVVDTSSPTGRLMFTVMAAIAQMELEIKTERIRDSVAKRKAKGGDLGGRRQSVSDDVIHGAAAAIASGTAAAQAARDRGISRATLYRRAKELGITL